MTVNNTVVLNGRLTKDLEGQFIETRNGDDLFIARATVAVDRPHRKGEDAGADFIRIKLLGNRWENVANYLTKGTLIGVIGRIETGQYENKDGDTVYTTEVLADEIDLRGTPQGKSEKSERRSKGNQRQARRN